MQISCAGWLKNIIYYGIWKFLWPFHPAEFEHCTINLISGYFLGAVKLTKGWKSCCDLTYLQHHKLGQSKTRFTHDDFDAWQVALGENQQAYIRTNTSNLKTARETIYGRAACLGFVEVWIYSGKHRSVPNIFPSQR